MQKNDDRKQKSQPANKQGLKQTMEGILERLRDGLDTLAEGMRPARPQPIPLPVPTRRVARR